jgi:hypothetical protein
MEIVFVSIFIGTVVFMIYQSLPNTKFEKANSHFQNKNYVEALSVLNDIFDKHIDAPSKFAECKLELIKLLKKNSEKLSALHEVLLLKQRITNSGSIIKFGLIETNVLFEIAKIQFEEAKGDIYKLYQNIKFIDNASKIGLEIEFVTLKTNHLKQLSESYLKKGEYLESQGNFDQAIVDYQNALNLATKSNFKDFIIISNDRIEKCESKIKLIEITKNYNLAGEDILKLNENLKLIHDFTKKYFESDFDRLVIKHYNKLADIYFNIAKDYEKNKNFIEATKNYFLSKQKAEKSSKSSIHIFNCITRIEICKLKQYQEIDIYNIASIEKSYYAFKNDFYYRFSLHLLKKGEFERVENIYSTHLKFISGVEKLSELLISEKIKNIINKVAEVNKKIEELYSNSLSLDELSTFYNSLDSLVLDLEPIDNELSKKIIALKPSLFNRILTECIFLEHYEKAINFIYKVPKFWESTELLKNLGICFFGYASKGLLDNNNYKNVISGWLTSVYSDNVILKSLEDTSWDDNYTFTLSESIGSKYCQHEELPNNVNYDDISETNISIGVTQRELLQSFELMIYKEIEDPKLSNLVIDFYNKEKMALEKIIDVIDQDVLFTTPHFAKLHNLNNEIIQRLDDDYELYSNEEALEAGVPYIENSTESVVYQYYFACDLTERIKSAILDNNLSAIKKINTKENKGWLENFENIRSTLEDDLYHTIAIKVSEDDENELLIPIMEECMSISSFNDKLKHQYSNYIASYCISHVNKENIDNYKALSLMKSAYLHSPNNPRICKNFITLIRFNLVDILNDTTKKATEIYRVLDWVKSNMSETFKHNTAELSETRKEILGDLKANGVNISLFEENRFGSILSDESLNSHGLQMKKVLTYLRDLSYYQDITNTLSSFTSIFQKPKIKR